MTKEWLHREWKVIAATLLIMFFVYLNILRISGGQSEAIIIG